MLLHRLLTSFRSFSYHNCREPKERPAAASLGIHVQKYIYALLDLSVTIFPDTCRILFLSK